MAKAQQLDLFGAMMAEPAVEPEPMAKEIIAIQEPIIAFVEETVFQEPSVNIKVETIVEFVLDKPIIVVEEKMAATNITSKPSFVFEDEKIATSIKPNKVTTSNYSLPIKSKRGRKSFKEMDAEVDLIDVPDEETLRKKLYYSISEVASWFKVNTSLIRAWSTQFDIIQPRKNRKGDRLFRAEDVKNLQIIYYLLRSRKFSVDGAIKYLKSNKKQVDTNLTLIQSLTKFRSFLLEMKANLEA